MQNNLLSLIIFAPLAGAVINWLVGRRLRHERFIGIVACASVGISTIVAFFLAFKSDGALILTFSFRPSPCSFELLAERVGFEPTVAVRPLRFSRPVH